MTEPKRRELSFKRLEDAVAEVDRLASGEVTVSGKHDFPSIVRHLAITNDVMTGRVVPPRPSWPIRMLIRLFRSSIVNGPVKPGFKLPANAEARFWPNEPIPLAQATAYLKESTENYRRSGPLADHPIFGKVTPEQMERLGCLHAAMHLSFVHPRRDDDRVGGRG